MRIAAVVVTFNRKQLLLECLNALKQQTYPLDAIFIIDGPSTDGTPNALKDAGYIQKLPPKECREGSWSTENVIESSKGTPIKVTYVRLYEDVGGAGGFHEGVKRAYKEGYDWIWLMDDDAEPKKDALENLVRWLHLPDAVALACLKIDENERVLHYHRGYFFFNDVFRHIIRPIKDNEFKDKSFLEIDHASFVGILINSEAIRKIGLPDKRFFITYDDVEYCIRLRTVGKIYLIPDSRIVHKEGIKKRGLIKKTVFRKTLYIVPYNKLWKSYYGIRNLTYLGRKYSTNRLKFYLSLVKRLGLSIGAIILFHDHKFKRILFVTSAYLDGLRGIFDNEKPKRILYGGNQR
ncbi:glycosyltransferase family 2 protein [Thermococcus sp. 5-4]|uniref:glycosyltransferase family 2 protein n=1 Tax=Thermococcus sp. 5-4 TaxID=2008440 RepID=UPI000B4A21B9|nr:glycosyltransferase family 2 protein [Thermococcus sp. 5-4]ASA78493.1 family 2 glycosyl transferase [Thermococcus sp. 5-4]